VTFRARQLRDKVSGERAFDHEVRFAVVAASVLHGPDLPPSRHSAADMNMTCSSMEHTMKEVRAETSDKIGSEPNGVVA
jgi:hypothetical protein